MPFEPAIPLDLLAHALRCFQRSEPTSRLFLIGDNGYRRLLPGSIKPVLKLDGLCISFPEQYADVIRVEHEHGSFALLGLFLSWFWALRLPPLATDSHCLFVMRISAKRS